MCTWNVAREFAARFRFVDFGEVSEACAPASTEGEAAQLFGQNIDDDM
jgi:hypothetical protein